MAASVVRRLNEREWNFVFGRRRGGDECFASRCAGLQEGRGHGAGGTPALRGLPLHVQVCKRGADTEQAGRLRYGMCRFARGGTGETWRHGLNEVEEQRIIRDVDFASVRC